MQPDAFSDLAFPVAREVSYSAKIEYSALLAPEIVATRDHSLISFLEFEGKALEGLSDAALRSEFTNRMQLYKLVNQPEVSLHYLLVKRRVTADEARPRDGGDLCTRLLETYERGARADAYTVDHYLAVILHRPQHIALGWKDVFGGLTPRRERKVQRANLEAIMRVRERARMALDEYGTRVLGNARDPDRRLYSEPLTLLYFLVNHRWQPQPLSTTEIGARLPAYRLDFSAGGGGRIGPHFFATKSARDFDPTLRTGALDTLLFEDMEYVLSLSFRFGLQQSVAERIRRQLRLMEMTGDEAVSEQTELKEYLDMVTSKKLVTGECNFHVIHYAPTPAALKTQDEIVTRAFDQAGMIAVDDNMAIECKYFATLPAHWRFRTRIMPGLHSANLAALLPFRALGRGQDKHHWGHTALFRARNPAGEITRMNLHVDDLGNTVVVGQSGGGKTVLMTYLACALRQAGARIVYWDKDRGAEIFIRAIGGSYHGLVPGEATGFNPFALPPTPANLSFVDRLVLSLLTRSGVAETPEILQTVGAAVRQVFSLPVAARQLGRMLELISRSWQEELVQALSEWVGDGRHAWLFDHSGDPGLYETPVNGFDMTDVLNDPVCRGPALTFLLRLMRDKVMDGSRAAIIIDEGWKALADHQFADEIKDLEKTIRKQNTLIIFGTNNPADLTATEAGREIVKQSPTRILTPNPDGEPGDYEGYQLQPAQVALALALRAHRREFALIQSDTTRRVIFDLGAHPGLLKLLSGRQSTRNEMNALIERHGPDPAAWLPSFHPDLAALLAPGAITGVAA